jgi:hypothetical protein
MRESLPKPISGLSIRALDVSALLAEKSQSVIITGVIIESILAIDI